MAFWAAGLALRFSRVLFFGRSGNVRARAAADRGALAVAADECEVHPAGEETIVDCIGCFKIFTKKTT